MSEEIASDKELFSLHPEFQNGVTIAENVITWTQYGYAISKRKFQDGIWKIKVRFDDIPAIAWFGILKCDDDKFDKGNVHDRSGLCVFHSNGFCNQSGFSHGNNPWKSEDVITLEVNLTQPTNPTPSPSVSSSSVDSSSSSCLIATARNHLFVVSAPTPSYLKVISQTETISYIPTHPFVVSAPSPSYLISPIELTSSSSTSSDTAVISHNPTIPVVSPPSPPYLPSPHPFVVSAPSPSYKAAVSLPSSSSYDSSTSTQPSYNTLHFYVNDELQPVSYVNIPSPLRFIVYCNYGDSKCEVLGIEPVEKKESAYFRLEQGGDGAPKVADIYDQEDKNYKARVVSWNPEWKRLDR